jgi:hypothetical protein
MKKSVMSLTIIAVLFLTSYSLSANTRTSASVTGIRITRMDTAIGGAEGNTDEQVFSYNLTLFNAEPVNVVVHWIVPVLVGEVSKRALTADHRVIVEKTLVPNTYLEISGGFTFDTKDVSKIQIMSWEPFLTGITVSSDITLSLPSQAGK